MRRDSIVATLSIFVFQLFRLLLSSNLSQVVSLNWNCVLKILQSHLFRVFLEDYRSRA